MGCCRFRKSNRGTNIPQSFLGNLLPPPNFWALCCLLILGWFVVSIFWGIFWLAIHKDLYVASSYLRLTVWPRRAVMLPGNYISQSRAKERSMMRNKQNIHPFFQSLMNTWMMRWRELRRRSCCGRRRGRLGSQVVVHVFTCTVAPDFTSMLTWFKQVYVHQKKQRGVFVWGGE